MNSMSLIFIITFVPTAMILSFIPYLTRKTENFGVSISEDMHDRPKFQSMRKKYAITLGLIGFIFTLIIIAVAFQDNEQLEVIFYTVAVFIYIILAFVTYIPFHLKMKKIKDEEQWQEDRSSKLVIDMTFRSEKITYSNKWFLIPIGITILTIIVSYLLYDIIPNKVPTHTSFSGVVTYSDKTSGILLLLPLSQFFLIGIMAAVNYSITHAKQQISANKPTVSKQQNIIFRRRWSLFNIATSILITLMFTFMQLTFIYQQLLAYQDGVVFSVIAIIFISLILITITTGQGGSRVKIGDQQEGDMNQLDDDHFWKLGQFYINKNDPSLIVEKRFGVGWTVNFAHPIVWVILIIILVVPFLTLFLI